MNFPYGHPFLNSSMTSCIMSWRESLLFVVIFLRSSFVLKGIPQCEGKTPVDTHPYCLGYRSQRCSSVSPLLLFIHDKL